MHLINRKSLIVNLKSAAIVYAAVLAVAMGIFALPQGAHAAVIQRPPNNLDLVAYYPMDEGRGNSVGDMSANGNDGTRNGDTPWVDGKSGSALDFGGDGSGDYVKASDIDYGYAFTVSFYFKTNYSSGTAYDYMFSHGPFDANSSVNIYHIEKDHGSFPALRTSLLDDSSGGSSGSALDVKTRFDDDGWHHYTLTLQNDGTARVYIDGEQKTSKSLSGSAFNPTTGVHLGVREDLNANRFYQGGLDDVRIYSRALTASEVQELYETGSDRVTRSSSKTDRYTDGLVGHWTFDGKDLTSTTANDVSGNSNDGTRNGTKVTNGIQGQALEFDNDGDFINAGDTVISSSTNRTACAWIKEAKSDTDNYIFSIDGSSDGIGIGGGTDGERWSFMVRDGELRIEIAGTGQAVSLNPKNNTWHLACAVLNGNTFGDHTLYLDTSSATVSGAANVDTDTSYNMHIGGANSGTVDFNGQIDDVRIYNRALSADEIKGLYQATKPFHQSVTRDNNGNSLSDGLVGHWTFDGPDMIGAVEDISGSGNDGYFNGRATTSAQTTGKIGQALEFDGFSDNVGMGDTLDQTGSFSISAWVMTNDPTKHGQRVVIKDTEATDGWALSLADSGNDGIVRFFIRNGGGSTDTGNILTAGEWFHVVGVFNKSAGTKTIYYNGEQKAQDTGITGSAQDNSAPLGIGGDPDNNSGGHIDGKLDDVRIYNRALSEGEIQRLYNMGR